MEDTAGARQGKEVRCQWEELAMEFNSGMRNLFYGRNLSVPLYIFLCFEIQTYLLMVTRKPRQTCRRRTRTALHWAAANGRDKVVRMLREANADICDEVIASRTGDP